MSNEAPGPNNEDNWINDFHPSLADLDESLEQQITQELKKEAEAIITIGDIITRVNELRKYYSTRAWQVTSDDLDEAEIKRRTNNAIALEAEAFRAAIQSRFDELQDDIMELGWAVPVDGSLKTIATSPTGGGNLVYYAEKHKTYSDAFYYELEQTTAASKKSIYQVSQWSLRFYPDGRHERLGEGRASTNQVIALANVMLLAEPSITKMYVELTGEEE